MQHSGVEALLSCPHFKKGAATDTANYRPIAVGEPISPIFASILAQRLVQYKEKQQLRTPTQVACRLPSKPCIKALLCSHHWQTETRQAAIVPLLCADS